MRKLLTFTLLALLILALALPTLAQTPRPEPTAAATPETQPSDEPTTEAAPTAEATPADAIVINTDDGTVTIPVDETPEDDNRVSLTIIEVVLLLVGGMVTGGAGVGTLAYFIMKDPARVALMERLAESVPPEMAAKIVGVTDLVTPVFVLVREMFDRIPFADKNAIEAGVAQGFANERQYQREALSAQRTNKSNVTPMPPMEPLNG